MKKLRNIAAALAIATLLVLNLGVAIAPAHAAVAADDQLVESDTPCTDRYGHDHDLWCACMWGKYGYEC